LDELDGVHRGRVPVQRAQQTNEMLNCFQVTRAQLDSFHPVLLCLLVLVQAVQGRGYVRDRFHVAGKVVSITCASSGNGEVELPWVQVHDSLEPLQGLLVTLQAIVKTPSQQYPLDPLPTALLTECR
jgi:hypothetical protein